MPWYKKSGWCDGDLVILKNIELFHEILDQLITQMDSLMGVLQEERIATIESDISRLAETLKKKTATLNNIRVLQKEQACQSRILFGPKIQSLTLETFFSQLPVADAQALRDKMSCVRSLVQAIQEVNDIQRRFVEHSLQDIHNRLQILSQGRGVPLELYGSKGLIQNQVVSSMLVQQIV